VELTEHLFRHVSGRLIAALVRIFGVHNLALAEDVVQDAFCRALEMWKVHGVPENPSGWLMTVARNRALDIVRKQRVSRTFAPEVARQLESEWTLGATIDEAFAFSSVRDEQLRMMFSCCHPQLTEDVQVALILNILCGFGAVEIANAFLAGRSAIAKRIARGKHVLAQSRGLFDLADADFAARLSSVRRALYLLFSEGYHSASAEAAVRDDLCAEAIRLVMLLLEFPDAANPETEALAALFHLQSARLASRLDAGGDLNLLVEQDRSRWDASTISKGVVLLERASRGNAVSVYHIEAAIAAAHATAPDVERTDWQQIVTLYDRLMTIAPSPIVALNRAIAIAQRDGPDRGFDALHALAGNERLKQYPFYAAALASVELRRGHAAAAQRHFATAAALARNAVERRFLERRQRECLTAIR